MRKIVPLIILILSLNYAAMDVAACLNSYTTDLSGQTVDSEAKLLPAEYIKWLVSHKDQQYWQEQRDKLAQQRANKPDFKVDVDYAVALLHLKQIAEAMPILLDVEKRQPGEYRVAVNLGTAYELSGENDKALEWIKEGIKRNKDSHHGTEWLHVKILEAKMEIAKDPNWLKTHSILGIDFGKESAPLKPQSLPKDFLGEQLTLAQIGTALEYQLHERLEFSSRPNAIVANLLFNFADIRALNGSLEHAKELYKLSLNYGPTEKRLIEKRLSYAGYIILAATYDRHPWIMLMIGVVTLSLAAMVGYLVLRRK